MLQLILGFVSMHCLSPHIILVQAAQRDGRTI